MIMDQKIREIKKGKIKLRKSLGVSSKKKKVSFCSEFAKIIYDEQIGTCNEFIKELGTMFNPNKLSRLVKRL
jgi:hypothetical protein